MSTLRWITEEELEQWDTNFVGRKTWKFYNGGEKMRNASSHLGQNEWQWKKKQTGTHMTFPSWNV